MNIEKFVKSIYLGDRACKKIIINSWKEEISIEVDTISRIRSSDGNWNFYEDEDIENGLLVFKKTRSFFSDPKGNIPNDRINYLDVSDQDDGSYCFTLSIDSVSSNGSSQEVILKFFSESIFLRDPLEPDNSITW